MRAMSENIKVTLTLTPIEHARLAGMASGAGLTVQQLIVRNLQLYGDDSSASVECPHCRFGFAPWVIRQHVREKHGKSL